MRKVAMKGLLRNARRPQTRQDGGGSSRKTGGSLNRPLSEEETRIRWQMSARNTLRVVRHQDSANHDDEAPLRSPPDGRDPGPDGTRRRGDGRGRSAVWPRRKAARRLLTKPNLVLPHDPVTTFLGVLPRRCANSRPHKNLRTAVLSALFTVARTRRQPRRPLCGG